MNQKQLVSLKVTVADVCMLVIDRDYDWYLRGVYTSMGVCFCDSK